VIVTGNIDIHYDALDAVGDMIITPHDGFEGERFEKFKALATAAKANGSLLVGQVTQPGRQLEKKLNPETISASDVQLGK
jgi:2,4-dienoyl-CoA reductase-like NADH-dependent reductase (Old Yellow Enzyme family)